MPNTKPGDTYWVLCCGAECWAGPNATALNAARPNAAVLLAALLNIAELNARHGTCWVRY